MYQQRPFGSTAKRLLADAEINLDIPPIGSYDVDKINTIGGNFGITQFHRQTSTFASSGPRFIAKKPVILFSNY